MWTPFQRLPFIEKCCVGKDIDGFVKVDFFLPKIDLFDLRRHLGF
jgi:hypothetical protein